MPTVSIEQLRARLDYMGARFDDYVRRSEAASGKLPRSDWWRHEYLGDPYLVGATDERLAERFGHVFINTTELENTGLVGLLPVDKTDFMRKFTHLLEEYGARGGVPQSVVESAREPILAYFKDGDPIAVRIFKDFKRSSTPILVKYGRREFLEPMLKEGHFRLCQASYYNDTAHNAAVRDDEISRNFCFPTYLDRLHGVRHMDFQGHRIAFDDDDIVLPVVFDDYFLMSLCDDVYYRMPTDFGADAALIVHQPERFIQRVISAFLARRPDWVPTYGPVTYYDPYRDYSKCRVPEMTKHFGYSYQREHRIIFRPLRRSTEQLQPEFYEIGSMQDYAILLSA